MISNNETDNVTDNDNNFYDLIIYMCSQNLLKMFCFYMLHCEYHFTHTYIRTKWRGAGIIDSAAIPMNILDLD